jgi:hypothetical protein
MAAAYSRAVRFPWIRALVTHNQQTAAVSTLFWVLLLAGLQGCDARPTAPSPSPPPPASPFAKLAGDYTLTLELDACAAFPQSLRVRTYDAVLEDKGWPFLPIRIAGGGFSESTWMADLWTLDDARFRLVWNDFDAGGCDYPEPLTDSTALYVCGRGTVTRSESIITGTLLGGAHIVKGNDRAVSCSGSEIRVTFARQAR